MLRRFLTNSLLFLSVLFFPWWLSVALGIAAIFYFRGFYEILGWAFLLDVLYGTPIKAFYEFQFIFTVAALVFLVVIEWAKRYLRWY